MEMIIKLLIAYRKICELGLTWQQVLLLIMIGVFALVTLIMILTSLLLDRRRLMEYLIIFAFFIGLGAITINAHQIVSMLLG